MQVKPNRTVVRGKVHSIRPEPDGWGAEVHLQVERNESPVPEEDFLRPADGSILKVFTPEPDKIHVGEVVRAEASLNAGPTGGRAVLQKVEPVAALTIVIAVEDVLHFRILDRDGRMVVDTDETKLTAQPGAIEDLRKQLEGLWPPHVTESEKARVIAAVTSIVGHTLAD